MLWFQLALAGSALYAVSSILDKHLLEKYVRWPAVPLLIAGFLDVLLAIGMFLSGFLEFSLTPVSTVLIVVGGVYYMGNYFYYRTVEREDISNIVPLTYVRPLFVAGLAGLVLGEVLGIVQYLGIFLIVAGAVLVGSRFKGAGFGKVNGIGVLLLGVFFWSLGDVVCKWGLGFFGLWEVIGYTIIGFGLCSMLLFANKGIRTKFRNGYSDGKKVGGISFLIYAAIISGWIMIIKAMSVGSVSLVSSVQSLQVLIVLLMSVGLSLFFPKFLKEEVGVRLTGVKIAAIALIILGVYLIS